MSLPLVIPVPPKLNVAPPTAGKTPTPTSPATAAADAADLNTVKEDKEWAAQRWTRVRASVCSSRALGKMRWIRQARKAQAGCFFFGTWQLSHFFGWNQGVSEISWDLTACLKPMGLRGCHPLWAFSCRCVITGVFQVPRIPGASFQGETAEDASGTRPLQILSCGTRPGLVRGRFSQISKDVAKIKQMRISVNIFELLRWVLFKSYRRRDEQGARRGVDPAKGANSPNSEDVNESGCGITTKRVLWDNSQPCPAQMGRGARGCSFEGLWGDDPGKTQLGTLGRAQGAGGGVAPQRTPSRPPPSGTGGRLRRGVGGQAARRGVAGGGSVVHEFPRRTLLWHASHEFAPRCEPHPARAKWGPIIRMGSGSTPLFG
eukprot:gene22840-biopygen16291